MIFGYVKPHVAMLCITLVLAGSLQPALADNVLPDPQLLYRTEIHLLEAPDHATDLVAMVGTIHEGGPFTLRSFSLSIPIDGGGLEYMVATYAWPDSGDEVHVTINAGGRMYTFVNFMQSPGAVDDFLARYLPLYLKLQANGVLGDPGGLWRPGTTIADRMMGFFAWLDEYLLETGDREYGFAQKFAWMRSDTYQRIAPFAAELLSQVAYADETVVDNGWVRALTFQDMAIAFDFPMLRVIDRELPVPPWQEMESFSLALVALETDQPMGGGYDWGFDNYYDCWNETWTGRDCLNCCGDWFAMASATCAVVAVLNPALGLACMGAAGTGYLYCRLGCNLANPVISEGWSGGA